MKSVNEMLNFLRSCLASNTPNRRPSAKREISGAPEAVEARLLLAANIADSLFNTLSAGDISESDSIESYFLAFDTPQDGASLQETLGASSATASSFVSNAYTLEFTNGLTLQQAADSFSELPGFMYLHPNVLTQFETRAVPNDPLYSDQWHWSNTGQSGGTVGADTNIESVWDNYTGQGVTIGIIDDGLEVSHEDLVSKVNTTIDFDWNGNDNDPSPGLFDNHGTAVAGVAAAQGNNSLGVTGAAWDAELVGLRLIGGPVGDTAIAEALTHELNVIDIYNNSWGPFDNGQISGIGPQTLAALEQAATTGRNGLGNIHTWAAGNGGDATNDNVNYDPFANSRYTIAVGALSNFGVRSSYSDTGASLIVTAYSNGGSLGITTTDQSGVLGYAAGNYENSFGGTSSAAPLVAGVIALMLEANPNLSYRDVTDVLARSAERVDPGNGDWVQNGAGLFVNHEYGFGGIDAAAAVAASIAHIPLGQEQTNTTGTQTIGQAIPESGGGSLTNSVTVTSADAIDSLEYVEVVFDATHPNIGDLQVVLTSPSGTQSILAETRVQDTQDNYSNWVFTTARNWGESSEGDWTLTVTDGQGNNTGTLNSYELRFFGTNQTVGPIITQTAGTTSVSDSGQTDTINVVLAGQPTSNVVLNVVSNDTSEVTVSDSTITFTTQNWNVSQTVTVSGVADLIGDGDQTSDVVFSIDASTSDPSLAGIAATTISVTSIDDDEFLPRKPVVTGPTGIILGSPSPTFTWVTGANTETVTLVVTNRLTGFVTRQVSGLVVDNHVFAGNLPDGVYETTVQGVNSAGQAGFVSDPVIFAIGTPAIPSTPSITSPTSGQFVTTSTPQFAWTPVQDALSYELFARSGTTTYSQTILANATGNPTHTFATPFAEGPATVSVRALNAFDQPGEWSTVVAFSVNAFAQPGAPTIITPTSNVTPNAFPEFTWTRPAGATTFELWVGRVPDAGGSGSAASVNNRVIRLTDHPSASYTHFSALRNGSYVAWVRTFNAVGEASPWSRPATFDVGVPVPERPAIVTFVENQGTNPTIAWVSTGDDFPVGSTFHVWVNNLSTGQSRVVQEQGLTDTTFSFTDGLPQGRYGVWVQATSSLGDKSPWSQRFDFEIDIASPGRPTLTGPAAVAGEVEVVVKSDFPVFTWDAVQYGETYDLWVNSVSGRVSQIIRVRDIPAGTSYTHDQALPEGTYKAWLRAANTAGEVGEWSSPIEFDLDVPGPAKPTITGPVPASGGEVGTSTPTITWTSLGGAASYNLQLEVVRTGESIVNVSGLTEQQYSITDTLVEQTYRVRAQGVNSVGEVGAWSDFYVFTIDVPNATTPVAFLPQGTVTEPQVTFQWQHTASSVRYEILVRDLLRQESIVIQVETLELDQTGSLAIHTASLNDSTYRYWVRAFNTQGTASGWSNSRSFTVDTVAEVTPEPESRLEVALASLTSAEQHSADDSGAQQPSPRLPEVTEERAIVSQEADVSADVEAVMAEFADPASPAFSQET